MEQEGNSPKGQIVSIQGAEVTRIEYRGEPVVTFAMVDKVHERPEGTAKRNFNENEERFVKGEDFVDLTSDEIRTMSQAGIFPPRTARGKVLTRRGYLKLTKPMNDDRAWKVQGEMIDRYFAVEGAQRQLPAAEKPAVMAREARLTFNHLMRVSRMLGLKGNHAILSANKGTQSLLGINVMGSLGVTHLPTEEKGAAINVSTLEEQVNLRARQGNPALLRFGYQTSFRDSKNRIVYEPTRKGEAAGGHFADTGKKHSNGTPVKQLMWTTETVRALKGDLAQEMA